MLTPYYEQKEQSFIDALHFMQSSPNGLLSSVIPEQIKFTVSTHENIAEVVFSEKVNLDDMTFVEASQFIDAITLTAASFGLDIKLTNLEPLQWNGLNFNETLPKALGANSLHVEF